MGTTEILVLAILTEGHRYGYEITREVLGRSGGFFDLKQGFLYPTLNRLERSKLIQSYWKHSESGGPNRKYYRLTGRGRSRLRASIEAWSKFSREFNRLLSMAKS